MGIHVTISLDVEPLTAELFFPLGLAAGTSVGIAVAAPSTLKADERNGTFSLCHALVCGRKVPIGRSNVGKGYDTPDIPKGLQVRSPLVSGKPLCQLKNVRRGAVEPAHQPPVSRPAKSAARAVVIPETTSAPNESYSTDTVIADDREECKKAIEDIIKTTEPSTKNVFECTECSHRTFDKEEAVEHCDSHLVSNGSAVASNKVAASVATPVVQKRRRPQKESFRCNTCFKSFLSEQRHQAHLRTHTSRAATVAFVSAAKNGNEIQPRGESAKFVTNSFADSRSSSPQTWPPLIPDVFLDMSRSISPDVRDSETYCCLGCTKSFASVTELDAHRQSVHLGSYFCHLCGEVFNEPVDLESHVTAAHGKGICFYCTLCLMVFVGEESFKSHKAECGVACATSKQRRREFICSRCSFITDTYAKLCDHVAEKHPNMPVQRCNECHEPFLHGAMLQHHHATVHSKSNEEVTQESKKKAAICLYPCTFCDRVFKSRQGVRAHTNMHKNFRPYECQKCGASLSSRINLQAHMVSIHGDPGDNAKCPHCPKVFKLMRSLKIHIRNIHSQESRKQCTLCGKLLATERKLQLHMALTHFGDAVNCQNNAFSLLRPQKCEQCDFKSFSYARLARHRVSHTGIYKHQCPECSKHFVVRDQLTRHIQIVHRKMRFTCPHCPRVFYSEKLFQHHLDAHRLGQGFPCTLCNNFFETKAAFDHHSQIHDTQLPLQCHLCKKRFKYPQGLSIHRRYHHGRDGGNTMQWNIGDHTWRYNCEVCHVRFKYQSSLAAHRLNRHAEVERLTCTYCSRSFKSQGVLALHIRSHTGEKPHVCPHCSRAFSIPSNLKNHIVTQHTKEFKFFCPLCSKGAISQEKLRQHLLQSHKAVNDSTSKLRRAASKTGPAVLEIQDLSIGQATMDGAASILAQIMM